MNETDIKAFSGNFLFRGRALRGTVEETHISWVVLTQRFAFKIKKPLRLSFLDTSSLSRRKKLCEKELKLNRRFSDIYLQVAPLRFDSAVWSIGGSAGKIMDYAVIMKRLQSSKRMDVLLSKGQVTEQSVIRLARNVGTFHAEAAIVETPFDGRNLRRLFNDLHTVDEYVSRTLGSPQRAIIRDAVDWSDAFIRKHTDRFAERVSMGYKRDLHGDLHSGNIFLYSDPVLFDCLEFNDALRQIDVLDEIAFLCMDLESFKRRDLSRQFARAYAEQFPSVDTPEDRAIFRYYKCYRANVRAKIHVIAASEGISPAERRKHLERAARYFALIRRYIRQ